MQQLIILLVLMVCLSLSIVLSATGGFAFYKAKVEQTPWVCLNKNKETSSYIIGRKNKGESECITNKDGIGCYTFTENDNSYKTCKSILNCDDNTYPNACSDSKATIKLANNQESDIYTCGPNSTHKQLYGTTGYEDFKGDCSKIQEAFGFWNTIP